MLDLIIGYAGKYGTTAELAARLEQEVRTLAEQNVDRPRTLETRCVPARELIAEQLGNTRMVVLGGPIYAGKLPRALTRFCERNRKALLARDVGLFISSLYQDERAREQLLNAYPQWLFAHAATAANLGGKIELAKLKRFDRLLMTRFAKVENDLDRIDDHRLASFAGELFAHLSRE